MENNKTDIWVYTHWAGIQVPVCIGVLSAHQAKGCKAFSFEYNRQWLQSGKQQVLDPDIGWYPGLQFPNKKENFGIFQDSMPDTWGRTLMKRKASLLAKEKGKFAPVLYDIDFLLGVYDESRMGALRFKLSEEGPFLDNDKTFSIPPWSSIHELQYAAAVVEADDMGKATKKWLDVLLAPGSSLGGARPKANILDETGHPWIAKFPSKSDDTDKAAWEFLAYKLSQKAGVEMAPSKLEQVAGKYNTFFTKRFDRLAGGRIHFASAMTMTGNNEDTIRHTPASYLDIAECIISYGTNVEAQLHQLWRRIIFNIAISNTDDHLRNHGFIMQKDGWVLSPEYDINPSIDKPGLALNIDLENNILDFELAKSVGIYFRLNTAQMNAIIDEVKTGVKNWRAIATEIGITRSSQEMMEPAFNY